MQDVQLNKFIVLKLVLPLRISCFNSQGELTHAGHVRDLTKLHFLVSLLI